MLDDGKKNKEKREGEGEINRRGERGGERERELSEK